MVLLPESRRLDFSEVELIDVGQLVDGKFCNAVVDAIARACSQTGFFYLCNHGIDGQTVKTLHLEAAKFFTLPMHRRMQIRIGPTIRGYLPLNYRSEETDSPGGTNLQEGFWMAHERARDPSSPFDGPNVWPEDLPTLRPAMQAYFNAAEALSLRLRHAFAAALGVATSRLDDMFAHPQSRLKLNHYPLQESPETLEEIGVVPHTDTGAYTILWQDNNGGLEIQNKNGEWVGVPPIDNTFVVNIGNMMQILSGGMFSSTPHRVINRSGGDRYSIAFFTNPDHRAIIEPLVAGAKHHFEPFSFGSYQQKEYQGIYPVAFDA